MCLLPQMERQYETLIKSVRSLEGDLADYNLAMDKSRTGTVCVCVCVCVCVYAYFLWASGTTSSELAVLGIVPGMIACTLQDPEDIAQYHAALRQRNEYEEAEIDKVFLMRQDRERAVADMEAQIRLIQASAGNSGSCLLRLHVYVQVARVIWPRICYCCQ